MKIVCDKCQTKYSIADEKVSGKVFKIRCKKCSHIIVVKGNEPSAASPDAALDADLGSASAAGDDRIWFLVVGGEQVGPLSVAEVKLRFDRGEVDAETYGWREGFGDWLRVGSIDELRPAVSAAPAPVSTAPSAAAALLNGGETRRTDVGDMWAAHAASIAADDGGAADIFGKGAAAARPVAAAPIALTASEDPFQGAPRTPEPAPSPVARPRTGSSGPVAPVAASAANDSKLTGQRNENSVLFSLNNLSAMATAAPAKPAASSPLPDARPGYATARNEGSGLIDIRAMAAATLSSSSTSSSSGSDMVSDIPSFSAAPVFAPVVAAPVMMPVPQQGGMPKWAIALLGVAGVAILGIGGAVVALLMRKPEPVVVPPIVAALPPPVPVAAPPVAAAPVAAPAAAALAAAPAEPSRAGADHKAAGAHKGTAGRSAAPPAKGAVAAAPVAAAAPAAAAAPRSDKPKRKSSDLDDILNAVPDRPGTRKPAPVERAAEPAEDPAMAESLDRGDVQVGMMAIKAQVMNCYAQYHVPGTALTHVTITKGKVTGATVGGALAGTPTGDCVEKAVKRGSFKKAKNPLSVDYPFILR